MPVHFLKCSIIAFVLQSFQLAILNAGMNRDFREEQGFAGWFSKNWTSNGALSSPWPLRAGVSPCTNSSAAALKDPNGGSIRSRTATCSYQNQLCTQPQACFLCTISHPDSPPSNRSAPLLPSKKPRLKRFNNLPK